MKTIILNIGLNNNPKSAEGIKKDFLSRFETKFEGFYFKIVDGQYNNSVEPTLIIKTKSKLKLSSIIKAVENLCSEYTQECIPVSIDDNGAKVNILVYNISYKGQKYSFNEEYFLI